MVDMDTYWPITLGIGIGTFLIRYSFILIMDKITLPEALTRMLRFIPASVLPALIVPAILLHKEHGIATFAGYPQLVGGLVAAAVAWKTKNILATIGSGMVVLWVMQYVLV